MDPRELEAWRAEEPSRGFAEGVMRAHVRGGRAPGRRKVARAVAGAALGIAAAAAALVVWRGRAQAEHGDLVADARQEVHVGSRAIAVLEKGAHVTWKGGAIAQQGGDVFWRVEPGARFVVHTPAADVTVKGTCFRVRVGEGEDTMTRRDAMVGAVGALVGASAFVGVYEGKVAVSHAGQSVDLAAGQSAEADARGVRRTGSAGTAQVETPAGSNAATPDPLLQANANLVETVHDYKKRLEALAAEKKRVEKELSEAEAKLSDGGRAKSAYDLRPEDWKELAKEGEVRMRLPCAGPKNDFSVSASSLTKLGFAPEDGPIVQAALTRSNARAWSIVSPLCSQALGDANVQRLGLPACMAVLQQLAEQQNRATYDEAVRQVAEIEAGMRPAPGPNDDVPPIERAYLALANESTTIVNDLAQTLGPDDARRFVYGDEGCWWNTSHGVGPREP